MGYRNCEKCLSTKNTKDLKTMTGTNLNFEVLALKNIKFGFSSIIKKFKLLFEV